MTKVDGIYFTINAGYIGALKQTGARMREIRIMGHVSLDGFIDEEGGWTAPYRSLVGLEALTKAQGKIFDLLLGRRTYDIWSNFWPKAETSPMAKSLNAAMKYVATHRPESLEWGPVKNLGKDVIESVRGLKSEDGPDLVVWGSVTLTSALFDQGLIDEVIQIVYPVLQGRGKRFFPESAVSRKLAFVSTKATPTGVLINTYRSVGSLAEMPNTGSSASAL